MKKHDLLILGGGVIGLSCAFHVASRRPDLRVAAIDRPASGQAASVAAAGMLAPWSEFREDSTLRALCVESLREYNAFLRSLREAGGGDVDCRWIGALHPAATPEEEEMFARRAGALAEEGVAARTLSRGELRQAWPALADDLRGALFVEEEGLLNPRDLHAALRLACSALGVQLIDAEVVGLSRERGAASRYVGATARAKNGREETIRFDRLLIATGAWSRGVAELAGVDIPVGPVKGQIARAVAPESLLGPILHAPEIYVAPRAGLIFGATMEETGFDSSVVAETSREMLERAARYLPALAGAPIVDAWAGLRPRPVDGLPALGRWSASRDSNLWLATGHFRNGILLTPATGRLLAESILRDVDGEASEAPGLDACFAPSRFAG